MPRRSALRGALLACGAAMAAILGASCGSGGHGGGGGPTPTPTGKPLGGVVTAIHGVTGAGSFANASAAFYTTAAHATTSGDPFAYIPMGTCVAPATTGTAGPPTSTYLDVGTAVNLVAGSLRLPLPKTPGGGSTITYSSGITSGAALPADTTWDVELTGSSTAGIAAQTWTGALQVPRTAVVTTPQNFGLGGTLPVPHNVPLQFVWSSSGSATAVVIEFSSGGGGGGGPMICRAPDTGSFVVGTATLMQISNGGAITFQPYVFSTHDLDGRGVDLLGETTLGQAYTP